MSMDSRLKPLEHRIFKAKKPVTRFFCPLCRTERAFSCTPRLSRKNYLQLFLSTVFFGLILYPFMGVRSYYLFFVFWAGFELVVRWRFRREIPCPHCGFDAGWYKRDVKVARRLVQDFWNEKGSIQSNKEAAQTTVGVDLSSIQNGPDGAVSRADFGD